MSWITDIQQTIQNMGNTRQDYNAQADIDRTRKVLQKENTPYTYVTGTNQISPYTAPTQNQPTQNQPTQNNDPGVGHGVRPDGSVITEADWQKHLAEVAAREAASRGFNTPEGNWYQDTQDEYNKEIDNAYNAGMNYWNTAEANLGKNLDIMKTQAQSDQEANLGELGANKASALTSLEKQKRAGETQKEDAFAAARRLYQQLQQGLRQRFGGATSAGAAVSEIQGAEIQRQMGQIWRQANEFGQQIMGAVADVDEQYKAGVLKIKQATQQALTNAQLDFNNSISQIAAGRAQTEQEKSQARLNALMDLRNKAFTIQQQEQTFQQQLETMKQQQLLNIDAYRQTTGSATSTGANAYNTFSQQAAEPTQYSQVGQAAQETTNPYVGQITNKFYDPKELLSSNSIANYLTSNYR